MGEDRESSGLEAIQDAVARHKKVYRPPALRRFGRVSGVTQGSGNKMPDFGSMSAGRMSDRALKHKVVRVGTHPMGMGLYLFNYIPGIDGVDPEQRRFGVMADEVLALCPGAVSGSTPSIPGM